MQFDQFHSSQILVFLRDVEKETWVTPDQVIEFLTIGAKNCLAGLKAHI